MHYTQFHGTCKGVLALLLFVAAVSSLECPTGPRTTTVNPLILSGCSRLSSLVAKATSTGGSTDVTVYVTLPPASSSSTGVISSTTTATMSLSSSATYPPKGSNTMASLRSMRRGSRSRTHYMPPTHTSSTSHPHRSHSGSAVGSGAGTRKPPGRHYETPGNYTDGVVIPVTVVCTVVPAFFILFLFWYCMKRRRKHRDRAAAAGYYTSNTNPTNQIVSAGVSSTTANTNTRPSPSPGSKRETPVSSTPPQLPQPLHVQPPVSEMQTRTMPGSQAVVNPPQIVLSTSDHTQAAMSAAMSAATSVPPSAPPSGQVTPGRSPTPKPVTVSAPDPAPAIDQADDTLTALPKLPTSLSSIDKEGAPWLTQLKALRHSKTEESAPTKRDSDEVRGLSSLVNLPEENVRESTATHGTHASQSSTSTTILNGGTWFAPSIPPSLQEQSEPSEPYRPERRLSSSWLSLASRKSESSNVTPPATAISTHGTATPKTIYTVSRTETIPSRGGTATPRTYEAPPLPRPSSNTSASNSRPHSPRNFSLPRRRPPSAPTSPPPTTPPPSLPLIPDDLQSSFWSDSERER